MVSREIVERDDVVLLERPNAHDERDRERLTETDLEQVGSNREFRQLADDLARTTYLHLVSSVDRPHPQAPENGPIGRSGAVGRTP